VSATKEARSPNSAPPGARDGKRRTPALRRTGSSGGVTRRSPGRESRSACVEASTSGFLRGRVSTMATRREAEEREEDHLTRLQEQEAKQDSNERLFFSVRWFWCISPSDSVDLNDPISTNLGKLWDPMVRPVLPSVFLPRRGPLIFSFR
jgi:hypothetical protein